MPRSSAHGSKSNPWSCVAFLPFTRVRFKVLKPRRVFPHPKTLGEHIRKCRLERELTQLQAAIEIGSSEQAVAQWEKAYRAPCAPLLPGIIRFLGYNPFPPA